MPRALLTGYGAAFRGLSKEVWLLALVSLVNRSGTMVLPFLTLYLTTQHGYEASEAGGILALYGTGAILGIAIGGRLVDRIGFRAVQLASLTLGGVVFYVLRAAGTGAAMAATVFVLGVVLEAFRPANAAAIAAYSWPAERTRAYGLHRLSINLGWSIGPALGGFLALVDYELLFWVDGTTCLAAAATLALALPKRAPVARDDPRPLRGGGSPWRDGVFLAAFALLYLQGLVFFQVQSTLPLFLREERGLTEDLVGLTIAVNTVLIVILEMQVIRAVERFDPLRLVALASVFLGLGFGLLPWAWGLPALMGTVVVWTLGEMVSAPTMSAWVANRARDGSLGRYMGAFAISFSLCSATAPLIGTAVYQHFGADTLWYGCLVLGGVTALGFLLLARRSGEHVLDAGAAPE